MGISRMIKNMYRNRELLLMSLPGVLFTFLFFYTPMVGLLLAFKNYRFDLGFWGSEWIGFKNFEFLFRSDNLERITRNTLGYNVTFITLSTVGALALAVMLNEIKRGWVKFHQTVLFFPYFVSAVVVGIIATSFLDHQYGFANYLLTSMGKEPVAWYHEASYWPFILVIVVMWKSLGFKALIYFAGIMAISPSLYEAARIDGASKWKLVTNITLPSLTPLIVILLILDIGTIFNADFGIFYFTPNDSSFLYSTTDVIDTYTYRALRVLGDFGMPTAVGLYQSCVGFICVLTANLIVRKLSSDNALW